MKWIVRPAKTRQLFDDSEDPEPMCPLYWLCPWYWV